MCLVSPQMSPTGRRGLGSEIGGMPGQSEWRQITQNDSTKKREHPEAISFFPSFPHPPIVKMVSQLVWKRASASRGVSETIGSNWIL